VLAAKVIVLWPVLGLGRLKQQTAALGPLDRLFDLQHGAVEIRIGPAQR
jgi:hypothetical protein